MSLKRTVSEIFDFKNAVTLKTGLGVRQGHWKYHHSIERIRLPNDILWLHLVSFLGFNVEKCRVLEIGVRGNSRSLKVVRFGRSCMLSLKVIENSTMQSGAHDFLLTFHSNHGPISYYFRERRRFQSKIAIFSHPLVFCVQLKWFPLELGTGVGDQKKLG